MDKVRRILKRSEQKKENTWSSEDLYPSDAAWEEAFAAVKGREAEFGEFAGKLAKSGEVLLAYLKKEEELELQIERLYQYAHLKGDEDTRNPQYQAMQGKLVSWIPLFQQAQAFVVPEIIAMEEEKLESFFAETEGLSLYRRHLQRIRRGKEHILSHEEEKLLAAAGEMAGAPDEIYGKFVYADLTFPEVKDAQGNQYPLTNGSYISLLESPDRILRENAFMTFYQVYENFKNTAAATLNAQVKQRSFFARARKYASTREAALDQNEVPLSVYDNLLEAVHENFAPMYRYVDLRRRALGVEKLHMYDLYAPMISELDQKISFQKAKEDVLAATAVLGEEYSRVIAASFEERWMDIYENEGKRSGAYSMGTRVHPFVLLNHKDNLDSEFTLAHELGHAMHSYLSTKNQPPVYSDYVIFVAEVASLCNESLLMQYLLGKTEEPKERAYLINYFLEQFRTTLYRQAMFAEFEKNIHARSEAGEALTAETISKIYYDLNCLYYGDGMEIDEKIAIEWARIPHFYYDFYVYQYSTGFAAAMALSRRILKEGEAAVRDYLEFLSGGSSADPITLLKKAGVDMTTKEPVREALQLFDELVTQMEELLA